MTILILGKMNGEAKVIKMPAGGLPEFENYVEVEITQDNQDTWIYKDFTVVPGDYIISAWIQSTWNSIPAIGVKDNAPGASGDPGVKYFYLMLLKQCWMVNGITSTAN